MELGRIIKIGRVKKRLSQKELAEKVGIERSSISQWESNNKIPAGDTLIKIATILDIVPELFPNYAAGKSFAITNFSSESVVKESALTYNADYRQEHKLYSMILYFCTSGEVKTKLSKLLFYADFYHYSKYQKSISKFRYFHAPFGPVPENYMGLIDYMMDMGMLAMREIRDSNGSSVKKMFSLESYGGLLEPEEIQTLDQVIEKLLPMAVSEITEISRREKGYQATQNGEEISYRFARDLQISASKDK